MQETFTRYCRATIYFIHWVQFFISEKLMHFFSSLTRCCVLRDTNDVIWLPQEEGLDRQAQEIDVMEYRNLWNKYNFKHEQV